MKATFVALIGAVSLTGPAAAQDAPFPTFVGVTIPGEYGFGWPIITVDSRGNRYVSERWRYWIRKITPEGQVTTVAGDAGQSGVRDGNGASARFSAPAGYLPLAADRSGELYVADTYNNIIRKISVDGDVTTIAGQAGVFGHVDGTAHDARFNFPMAIALGPSGVLYIADSGSIRTLSPDGIVRTVAGNASPPGQNLDGVGSNARLHRVGGIAVDRDGNVYAAGYDDTVRKITAAGVVTTLAGGPNQRGLADGIGTDARFYFSGNIDFEESIPIGIAVDGSGHVWVTDSGNQVIRKISPAGVVTTFGRADQMIQPTGIAVDDAGSLHVVDRGRSGRILTATAESTFKLHAAPPSQSIAQGTTAVFSVAASGAGLRYQWTKDGVALAGATAPTLVIPAARDTDAGAYGWSISGPLQASSSGEARLVVDTSETIGRLMSVSVRSDQISATSTVTMGATIGGAPSQTMPVLIRAVGASLRGLGIPENRLGDLILTLLSAGKVIASNDDWAGDIQVAARALSVGAFPFASPSSSDAAIATSLASGVYLMEVGGKGDGAGIAIAEFFDARPGADRNAADLRIVNLSARKQLGMTGETLTVGFVIGGPTAKTVLIRVAGPSLAAFGVPAPIPDPMLRLFAGPTLIRENHDWGGDEGILQVGRAVNAFALSSVYSKDAALTITLPPGSYTLEAQSQDSSGGTVVAEVFEVP